MLIAIRAAVFRSLPLALAALAIGVPGLAIANTGNAWHIAASSEPGIPSMRSPFPRVVESSQVVVFSGNQFKGSGGNPGNQTQSGSAVLYRAFGDAAYTEAPLLFHSEAGNNKYFSAQLPEGTPGQVIEYYFRVAYTDHDTTFVFGNDVSSQTTAVESAAQSQPFSFQVSSPLTAGGPAKTVTQGGLEARLYEASGHIALAGPDRTGAASEVVFAPPSVEVDGTQRELGAIVAERAIAGGIEIDQRLGARIVTAQLRFVADGVLRYEVTNWNGTTPSAVQLVGASDDTEHFYGFGEKFNALDQAGKTVLVLAQDAPGNKGDRSYKAAPWFMSTRGYGFHLDSSSVSRFDMRATEADRMVISQPDGTLAFEIIYGPALTDVLSRYTALTGRPPLPPPWVFGPWMSSDIWKDGGEVRYVISKYRELGIPGSVFVFDSPWEVAYNDFTWNMTQFGAGGTYEGQSYAGFASVDEMMTFLRQNGFKVVVWLTPFINVSSVDEVIGQNTGKARTYDEAAAEGYFVRESPGGPPLVVSWWKGEGSPVDFTNPAARTWFQNQLTALVDASNGVIGGFKADDGESDFIPLSASYADGRNGALMKNAFSVAYHEAMYEILGPDGVLFSRSGFTGTQAFPGYWAGDNEPNFGDDNGLPSVIVAGLSAAMSGYSIWGHDIGGYQETNEAPTPANLFMRWAQFGALSPIMQMHRQVGRGKHYPWSYGEDALNNYREYAALHTALFPYIYTYAAHSERTGLPIMRPLVLRYPDDANTYDIGHAYLFGDELLVAPVIQDSATARSVYLPEGQWIDWFSGEQFAGGAVITWQAADQHRMPLFARAGAIVPMLREVPGTLLDASYTSGGVAGPTDDLEIRVYPSGTTEFSTNQGVTIGSEVLGDDVQLVVNASARVIQYRVLASMPTAVTRDGAAIAKVDDLDQVAEGWAQDGVYVRVKFAHTGGESTVVLGDAQKPPTGSPAGGCGCRSSDGAGSGVGLLILLLITLVRRRRKRTAATVG